MTTVFLIQHKNKKIQNGSTKSGKMLVMLTVCRVDLCHHNSIASLLIDLMEITHRMIKMMLKLSIQFL